MTLILRPPGRGNWSPLVLSFDERHHAHLPVPIGTKPGDRLTVNGREYRVAEVRA